MMGIVTSIFTKCIKSILMLLMIVMVFTVSYGVFTRYVLNEAAVWTGELASYTLVWLTFLGAGWGILDRSHITFDSLIEKLPFKVKAVIQIIFRIAMIGFSCLMTYYGFLLAVNSMNDLTLTLPITKGVVYMIIPISGSIMVLGFILEIIHLLSGKELPTEVYDVEEPLRVEPSNEELLLTKKVGEG